MNSTKEPPGCQIHCSRPHLTPHKPSGIRKATERSNITLVLAQCRYAEGLFSEALHHIRR